MVVRRIAVVVAGAVAVVVVVASTAWACFVAGTAPNLSVTPHAAPGARVTVTGQNWVADAEPVAIRWGSVNGAVLTYGHPSPDTRGGFSAVFTVPNEAGPHYVYAVQPDSETQATAIDVTAPAASNETVGQTPAPQSPKTAISTTGGATPAPASAPAPASVEAGAAPATTGSPVGVSAAPAVTDAGPLSAARGEQAPRTPSRSPATATRAPAAQPGAALRTLLPSAPAVAPGTGDEEQQAPQPVPLAVPSLRSASGDVWSGLERAGAPSLTNLPGATGSPETSEGLIGLGLLVAGAIALTAGFAAAELRRRKALIGSSRSTI